MRPSLLCVLVAAGCHGGFHLVPGGDGGAADMSGTGWRVVRDQPDGGALRAVFGVAPDEVHAVGDSGRVVTWDGNSFTEPMLGSGYDLTSGWGISKTDQWICGVVHGTPDGILFHLGATPADRWVQANTEPIPNGLLALWAAPPSRARSAAPQWWSVGYNGVIYSTDAKGPFHMGNQVPPSPCHGMMTFAPLLWSVSGNSATSVGIAGDVCTAYFFDGTLWNRLTTPDTTRIFRSAFGAPSATTDLYFGANYYGLWHFDGTTLEIQINEERGPAPNIGLFIWSIWGPDTQHLIAVGDAGRIMTYDAGKQQVTIRPSPTTRSLYGVWGSSADDVWIVGEQGLILRGSVSF
jgi:hypothetical protein